METPGENGDQLRVNPPKSNTSAQSMKSGSRRQGLKAAEGVMPQMRREIHGAADDVDADIAPGLRHARWARRNWRVFRVQRTW